MTRVARHPAYRGATSAGHGGPDKRIHVTGSTNCPLGCDANLKFLFDASLANAHNKNYLQLLATNFRRRGVNIINMGHSAVELQVFNPLLILLGIYFIFFTYNYNPIMVLASIS